MPATAGPSRRGFFTKRNLIIIGAILVLVAGFLIYRQITAGPSSDWIATNDISTGYAVYYLHWDRQDNVLNGTWEIIGTSKVAGSSIQNEQLQFTGSYNSQDQAISLSILSLTRNGQTQPAPSNTVETGTINGNILTLDDTAHLGFGVMTFHAGSRDEYNQDVQQVNQIHAQMLVTATAQAKATAQANRYATATAQAQAQATITATNQIYTQTLSTTPTLDDSLADNADGRWTTLSHEQPRVQIVPCTTSNNTLDVSSLTLSSNGICFRDQALPRNFLVQTQVSLIKGNKASLILNTAPGNNQSYIVDVSSNGDYDLTFDDFTKPVNSQASTLFQGNSAAIAQGLGQNQYATVALLYQDNTLSFYFNNKYIASANNISIPVILPATSAIGLEAASEALFRNLKLWSLS
jgi:hypothetical protein